MKVKESIPEGYTHCFGFQWAITNLFADQIIDLLQATIEQPDLEILVLIWGAMDKDMLLRFALVQVDHDGDDLVKLANMEIKAAVDIPALQEGSGKEYGYYKDLSKLLKLHDNQLGLKG